MPSLSGDWALKLSLVMEAIRFKHEATTQSDKALVSESLQGWKRDAIIEPLVIHNYGHSASVSGIAIDLNAMRNSGLSGLKGRAVNAPLAA